LLKPELAIVSYCKPNGISRWTKSRPRSVSATATSRPLVLDGARATRPMRTSRVTIRESVDTSTLVKPARSVCRCSPVLESAEVVRKQAQLGLDIINDSEYGKTISWSRYVLERMSGFEQRDRPEQAGMPVAVARRDRREFAEFYADYDRHQGFTGMTGWALTGPIHYTGQAAIERDIANFKAASKGVKTTGLFMAAVAPASVAPDRIDEFYKSDEEYVFAVAQALHEEYKAIIDSGLMSFQRSVRSSYQEFCLGCAANTVGSGSTLSKTSRLACSTPCTRASLMSYCWRKHLQ
jgi:hypothetical protein